VNEIRVGIAQKRLGRETYVHVKAQRCIICLDGWSGRVADLYDVCGDEATWGRRRWRWRAGRANGDHLLCFASSMAKAEKGHNLCLALTGVGREEGRPVIERVIK
jgi:hypothetical protein